MITIARPHYRAACITLLLLLCCNIPLRKGFARRVSIHFYHKILYCRTSHKFVYSYEAVKTTVAERLLKQQARLGREITAPNIG
jgi:hypothetical protein